MASYRVVSCRAASSFALGLLLQKWTRDAIQTGYQNEDLTPRHTTPHLIPASHPIWADLFPVVLMSYRHSHCLLLKLLEPARPLVSPELSLSPSTSLSQCLSLSSS